MTYFAIGDLHLSGTPPQKPMNIFGPHWDNHWERIQQDWKQRVQPEDIVFLVGDTSWFLKLQDAVEDLTAISALPGRKILIRGNHDYWWSSVKKMTEHTNGAFTFLQGHGLAESHVAFGGTRGYLCPNDDYFNEETDRSIYERELLRTEAALKEMDAALTQNGVDPYGDEAKKILLLHYPPFNDNNEPSGFTELLDTYNVDHCIFGHLHDENSFARIPKTYGNTQIHLVSADYKQFQLEEIIP